MKHIFAFIDKLIILLKFVPVNLETEEDKIKAQKAIVLINEYTTILEKLINAHKTTNHLKALHNTHNEKIENWVEYVDETFKKMNSLLKNIDDDIKNLSQILQNKPDEWKDAISYMAMGMVMTGLHDEEENMKKLKEIATFQIHELETIIDHEKHNNGLIKWNMFTKLSEEERVLEHEKFFVELLS